MKLKIIHEPSVNGRTVLDNAEGPIRVVGKLNELIINKVCEKIKREAMTNKYNEKERN